MTEKPGLSGSSLKRALAEHAAELGFQAVGVSSVERLDEEAERLRTWLSAGYHGTMAWMENHFEKRVDPGELVPGARSIISVIENYYHPDEHDARPETGKISRYAWGDDYHLVMRERLNALLEWLRAEAGPEAGPVEGRVFVDSAPVMDKVWAARSGLGWIGKHTNLINQRIGSWFFIGELVVDLELEPDGPVPDLCGTCRRCIDACPTDAIVEPYVLEARRCISYLTIEHRADDIPDDLRKKSENWIFGCDICQEVCPWNKFARPSGREEYRPRPGTLDSTLETWSTLSEDAFRERFGKSPVKRAKWAGFSRNVRNASENVREDYLEREPGA